MVKLSGCKIVSFVSFPDITAGPVRLIESFEYFKAEPDLVSLFENLPVVHLDIVCVPLARKCHLQDSVWGTAKNKKRSDGNIIEYDVPPLFYPNSQGTSNPMQHYLETGAY